MQKILLFDFDGTVADTASAVIEIYNSVARKNAYKEITRENFSTLRSMSVVENARYLGVPLFKLPLIGRTVKTLLKNELHNLKPMKEIEEPLRALKERGHALYIVSSNSKDNIQKFLKNVRIDVFEDVYAVSDIFGKGRAITRLIGKNRWDQSQVIYIGDETRDIEAAKSAHIKAVGVTWGYNTEALLLEHHPDMILRHPTELALL